MKRWVCSDFDDVPVLNIDIDVRTEATTHNHQSESAIQCSIAAVTEAQARHEMDL